MEASYKKYMLNFKRPSGTSRGVMTQKETWFLVLKDGEKLGIGECGILRGLSFDDTPAYEAKLQWLCKHIQLPKEELLASLEDFPSIKFGLEQALLSLQSDDTLQLFPSGFTQQEQPIPINGLIWMGDKDFMFTQIKEKISAGFSCIKMKIGAIDFDTELGLLKYIRQQFPKNDVELRVDANGAFLPENALEKLKRLAALELHSIEQPIKAGQWELMAQLCDKTPLPIALDEELIGVTALAKRSQLLQTIKPQYIILKPSLVGGFADSTHWINLAETQGASWWITSALESNIGLNAIAQWTYTLNNPMPQGLGTGSLFTNNFDAPLQVEQGQLFYRKEVSWPTNLIADLCT